MGEEDEPNPVLWLVIRVAKMALPCPLKITRYLSQENSFLFPYNKLSFMDQPCLAKMGGY